MKAQQAPLRLTARGEAVRDYLEAIAAAGAILVAVLSTLAILKLIGY
jgi:hypothetical protein